MQNYIQIRKPKARFPWRLLQSHDRSIELGPRLRFYSFTNRRKYSISVPPHLPRQIVGCSKGFIGLVGWSGKGRLHIYNPITRAHFTFPKIQDSITTVPFLKLLVDIDETNECKHVAFLANPYVPFFANPRYPSGGRLVGIAKLGDARWRYFDLAKYHPIEAWTIQDIILHNGRLHVITYEHVHALVFDLSDGSSMVIVNQLHPVADISLFQAERVWWAKFVESSSDNNSDLFCVIAYGFYNALGKIFHEVFRFDECKGKWDVVHSVSTQFSIFRQCKRISNFSHRKSVWFCVPRNKLSSPYNRRPLYSVCPWETFPCIPRDKLSSQSRDRSGDCFILIDAVKKAEIELKIYNCDDDSSNQWFLPTL